MVSQQQGCRTKLGRKYVNYVFFIIAKSLIIRKNCRNNFSGHPDQAKATRPVKLLFHRPRFLFTFFFGLLFTLFPQFFKLTFFLGCVVASNNGVVIEAEVIFALIELHL